MIFVLLACGSDDAAPSESVGVGGSSAAVAGGSAGRAIAAGHGGAAGPTGRGSASGGPGAGAAGAVSSAAGAASGGETSVYPPGDDGGASTLTWTEVYATYFQGSSTPGHCGRCHSEGTSKGELFSWLVSRGYIVPGSSGATTLATKGHSILRWFGGSMPKDSGAANAQAVSDIEAWVAAGAEND